MVFCGEEAERATALLLSDAHFHLGFVLDPTGLLSKPSVPGRSSLLHRLPLVSIRIPKKGALLRVRFRPK